MKINNLLENITTTASNPDHGQGGQAPKFGRSGKFLEEKDETVEESTTSGSVASVASPVGGMQSRAKGSMFAGISTSDKYPNSKAVKEGAYEDGINDGIRGEANPRASSIYGPESGEYSRGYKDGLVKGKEQQQANVSAYQTKLAPYKEIPTDELKQMLRDLRKRSDEIQAIYDKSRGASRFSNDLPPNSEELRAEGKKNNEAWQAIHQELFQRGVPNDQRLEEESPLDRTRDKLGAQGYIGTQSDRLRNQGNNQEYSDRLHQSRMDQADRHRDIDDAYAQSRIDYWNNVNNRYKGDAEEERDRRRRNDDDWQDTFDMMRDRINRYQYGSQRDVDPEQLAAISNITYTPRRERNKEVEEAKKANTKTARKEFGKRDKKPTLSDKEKDAKQSESDRLWAMLQQHIADAEKNKEVKEANKFLKPGPATTGKFPEPRKPSFQGDRGSKSETLGKDGLIYHWQDPRAKQGMAEGQEVDTSVVIGKLYDIIDHAEDSIKNADTDRQVQYATTVRDRAVKALNMIKTNPSAAEAAWQYLQNGEQVNEKSKSQAQFRTMAAVANNPKFAKKVGISQKVGKEFHSADKKQDYKDLPKEVDEEKQRLDPKCWSGYKKQGTKMKGDTRVNNCVPIEEAELNETDMLAKELFKQLELFKKGADKDIGSKAKDRDISNKAKDKDIVTKEASGEYDDEAGSSESNLLTTARAVKGLIDTIDDRDNLPEWVQEKIAKAEGMLVASWDYLQSQKEQGIDPQVDEDWQKANKSDKTDGMSPKAVKAYRRENPGSKLKTAVTKKPSELKAGSKDAKRRKSFCARMSGNKGPMKDEKGRPTPKAKALSRWNC